MTLTTRNGAVVIEVIVLICPAVLQQIKGNIRCEVPIDEEIFLDISSASFDQVFQLSPHLFQYQFRQLSI